MDWPGLGCARAKPAELDSPVLVFCPDMMLGCRPTLCCCEGVNDFGGKQVAMAELREVVASLGHADVMTYIESGNVLFTARPAGARTAGRIGTGPLAAELEQAIAVSTGVR